MKLIAIDLDGTLLSTNGTISKENIEAIHDVQKQGDTIVVCTGRSFHDTQQILLNAGIDCPTITGNGALSFHLNKCIQKLIMPDYVVKELLSLLDQKEYYYEIYTNQGIHLLHTGREQLEGEIRVLKENNVEFPYNWAKNEVELQFQQHDLTFIYDYNSLEIPELEIYKIFILSFSKDRLQQIRDYLGIRQDMSLTTSGITKLEIAHKEVSKGNALIHMAKYLNIPIKDTLVIGDELNDISMFKVAGVGIAMGNANEIVKKYSTYITRNNNDNGVAYALRKYVLNKVYL